MENVIEKQGCLQMFIGVIGVAVKKLNLSY